MFHVCIHLWDFSGLYTVVLLALTILGGSCIYAASWRLAILADWLPVIPQRTYLSLLPFVSFLGTHGGVRPGVFRAGCVALKVLDCSYQSAPFAAILPQVSRCCSLDGVSPTRFALRDTLAPSTPTIKVVFMVL